MIAVLKILEVLIYIIPFIESKELLKKDIQDELPLTKNQF